MATTWKPEQSFYPSPDLAMQAPPEKLAYVIMLDAGGRRPDAVVTVDTDPISSRCGQLIGRIDMPNAGDELHHFGWNACSSCLCPDAPHPHVERRYLIWGAWDATETWEELDELLRARFPHALGGRIGIDAAAVDAGDGTTMNAVIAFCTPRTRRRVLAIKGAPGNRPLIEPRKSSASFSPNTGTSASFHASSSLHFLTATRPTTLQAYTRCYLWPRSKRGLGLAGSMALSSISRHLPPTCTAGPNCRW